MNRISRRRDPSCAIPLHSQGLMSWFRICFAVVLSLFAHAATGQTVHVTLQDKSGGASVTGRFLGMSDDAYVLSTNAGRFTVDAATVDCIGRACPVIGELSFPDIAPNMQRIELSALDGKIDVEGRVHGFVDDKYIVDVPSLGLVMLRRSGLRCSGPGCRIREFLELTVAQKPEADNTQPQTAEADLTEPARVIPIIGEKELTESLLYPLLMEFIATTSPETEMQRLSRSSYSVELGTEGAGIFVGGTGIEATFNAFLEGAADFALTSRRMTDQEAAELVTRGLKDIRGTEHETVLTVDSLSVVVNAATGIDVLELSQLAAIYRGDITNWAQLGGEDARITVASRETGSAANTMFTNALFGETGAPFLRGAIIANSTQEMADIIANDRYAIGYLRDTSFEDVQKVRLVGACGLVTAVTPFSRLAEDGLMQQRIYLYSHPQLTTNAGRDLKKFVTSPAVDAAFAKTPFPGFDVLRMPLSASHSLAGFSGPEDGSQRRLTQQFISEVPNWDRLSTTIRFPIGTTGLGQKEEADITRLVSYIATLPKGSEIAVVGFADTSGPFDINLRLAGQRAELVERRLLQAGKDQLSHVKISSRAYGELAPLVCDTTDTGRALNRRVEVWLKTAQQ